MTVRLLYIIYTEDCMVQVDLVLLIDGSHSVKPENFNIIRRWVKEVAASLHFDNGQVQIGVVSDVFSLSSSNYVFFM